MWHNGSASDSDGTEYQVTSDPFLDVFPSLISVSVLALPWIARFWLDRKAAMRDTAAVAVIASICNWRSLSRFISRVSHTNSILMYLATLIAIFSTIMISQNRSVAEALGIAEKIQKEPSQPKVSPLMVPCRTIHSRLFPAKHSFSYSYLFVGIPVGWTGRAGSIFSTDCRRRAANGDSRRTWFSVEAEDYLERGTHPDGLRGKLSEYLRSQGAAPEQYPHTLLVTAPRFLGFSFNPVSFWYLYNEAGSLQAMVVEVNNTFDERRIYFMERAKDDSTAPKAERHFKHGWEKDFHVSPFNSRDGSYSLQAADPYANAITGNVNVDCQIVLSTTDQKAKIVARVFATSPAIDVVSMTKWQTLTFVYRWWWVGFMTNPRILREAGTLWAKKLQVYYRPEVMKTCIGRQESREEAQLEPYFRVLLEQIVECSQSKPLFNYISAAGARRGVLQPIGLAMSDPTKDNQPVIEIRVLTPAFYSHFVKFPNYREAFDKLCFNTPDSGKHVFISDRAAFLDVLSCVELLGLGPAKATLRWRLLAWLRGKTPMYRAMFITARDGTAAAEQCMYGLSWLDIFIVNNSDYASRRCYYRNVTTLLISDRLAFGWTEILRLYAVVIWASLVYLATSSSQKLLSPRPTTGETENIPLVMLRTLGPHLWALGIRVV